MSDISEKVVLVLGASGGIGSAIADRLAEDGARVCRHGRAGEYAADVRNEGEIKMLIEKIVDQCGRLDVIVNSVSAPIILEPIEGKAWDRYVDQMAVQLQAAVHTMRYAFPHMKNRKYGQIVNITSYVVVDSPPKRYADYVTAKYALLGLTRSMAEELRPHGIFANCVSPDFVETKLTNVFPPKLGEFLAAQHPSKKLTTPADVARVVHMLLTAEPPKTGEHIVLRGGEITDS